MGKKRESSISCSQMVVGIAALISLALSAGTVQAASVLNSCTTYCHGAPPRDGVRKGNPHFNSQSSAFLGNHRSHLPATPTTNTCSICHTPVSLTDFGHQNGVISMANSLKGYSSATLRARYDKGILFNQTSIPNLTNARCSNVNCHFEKQTPVWGTAVTGTTCETCHGALISALTLAHPKHIVALGNTITACASCHNNYSGTFYHATSAGRAIAVTVGAYTGSNSRYFPSQTGRVTGTCSAVVCHGAGTLLPWSGTLWSTTDQCGKCHSSSAAGAITQTVPFYSTAYPGKVTANTDAKVGAHTNHMTSQALGISASTACTDCHGTVTLTSATHMNGATTFAWSALATRNATLTPIYTAATGQCTATYCHGNSMPGGDTTGTNKSPTWINPNYLPATISAAACGTCHGFPPSTTSGHPGGITIPAGFPATATIGSTCSCHSNINTAGNSYANIFVNPALHINGTLETPAGGDCLGCHNSVQGVRGPVVGQFASQSHHIQGSELPLTTADCYKCHWEANSDGSINSIYHSATAGKGVSLVVWNGTTRPTTATMGTTYISYTANGSRQQIAKLNIVCLGCHNSAGIPTANLFGTYATDQYSPEARLATPLAKTSILSRYSSTRTVAWSQYKYSSATGNSARFGTNNKAQIIKALSAHGNAVNNKFPLWDASAGGKGDDGYLNTDSASATLSRNRNVFCYDCHNSHGSDVAGITSSYSSVTGRFKGGLLKSTVQGQGGYTVTYKPAARTIFYKNYSAVGITTATINAGASICNDCHNNDTRKVNISRPWSITGTYSSTMPIVGYWSTPYFDNYTFASAKRTTYKAGGAVGTNKDLRKPMGGHFGTSVNGAPSTRHTAGAQYEINGLCTPCHDPHGVSNALGANRDHGVPLLKGTWATSPYREDKADILVKRGGGSSFTGFAASGAVPGYHIDQNTFMPVSLVKNGGAAVATARGNLRSQRFRSFSILSSAQSGTAMPNSSPAVFAGLCINCHTQALLTGSSSSITSAPWMSVERVHQSVAGWSSTNGTNTGNKVHSYTCAKCHAPHVSRLPRLLVTNCLDVRHFGRRVSGGSINATGGTNTPGNMKQNVLSSSAFGAGRFPGGGSRYSNTPGTSQNPGGWWFQTNGAAGTTPPSGATLDLNTNVQPAASHNYGSGCHNAATAGGATYDPTKQIWNKKSHW